MLESNLHVRVLQNQLIPKLGVYMQRAAEELNYAMDHDVPQAEGTLFPP
jgi:hypothetical protein